MDLEDVDVADPRVERDLLAVLRELRSHLTADSFRAIYREGHEQGLRYLAAYEHGRCVGVAGWRIVATTDVGRKLYVDDLVTTATHRGRGVGAALLGELAARARRAGCSIVDLDSGTQRADAHRFYDREGFVVSSYHFARPVDRR